MSQAPTFIHLVSLHVPRNLGSKNDLGIRGTHVGVEHSPSVHAEGNGVATHI